MSLYFYNIADWLLVKVRLSQFMKYLYLLFLPLLCVTCNNTKQEKLRVATAANMQFAMKALSEAFTEQTGIDCDLVISSSGKLTAQIKEGAPYDIFVAANLKYPQAIYEHGLAQDSPKVYAYGKLVLWTMRADISPTLSELSEAKIRHIALANPKTAPYGEAALNVLKHYGLLDSLQHKLVYGESIAQTNQFISSQAADVGFTAMSVVQSPHMQGRGHWLALDEAAYTSIEQGVVLIKRAAQDSIAAQQFYNFLFSEEARQILKDFGYSIDE